HTGLCKLHNGWHADSHAREHADQFAANNPNGGQQEFLPSFVGLGEDVVAVVKVIEQLPQLKGVLGSIGRLGGCDALIHDVGGLVRCQPKLLNFTVVLVV